MSGENQASQTELSEKMDSILDYMHNMQVNITIIGDNQSILLTEIAKITSGIDHTLICIEGLLRNSINILGSNGENISDLDGQEPER